MGSRSPKFGNSDQLKKDIERSDRRAGRNPAYQPSLGLLAKLGSIIVHADELLSVSGHEFDTAVLRQLLKDRDVQAWVQQMGPLLPKKR